MAVYKQVTVQTGKTSSLTANCSRNQELSTPLKQARQVASLSERKSSRPIEETKSEARILSGRPPGVAVSLIRSSISCFMCDYNPSSTQARACAKSREIAS